MTLIGGSTENTSLPYDESLGRTPAADLDGVSLYSVTEVDPETGEPLAPAITYVGRDGQPLEEASGARLDALASIGGVGGELAPPQRVTSAGPLTAVTNEELRVAKLYVAVDLADVADWGDLSANEAMAMLADVEAGLGVDDDYSDQRETGFEVLDNGSSTMLRLTLSGNDRNPNTWYTKPLVARLRLTDGRQMDLEIRSDTMALNTGALKQRALRTDVEIAKSLLVEQDLSLARDEVALVDPENADTAEAEILRDSKARLAKAESAFAQRLVELERRIAEHGRDAAYLADPSRFAVAAETFGAVIPEPLQQATANVLAVVKASRLPLRHVQRNLAVFKEVIAEDPESGPDFAAEVAALEAKAPALQEAYDAALVQFDGLVNAYNNAGLANTVLGAMESPLSARTADPERTFDRGNYRPLTQLHRDLPDLQARVAGDEQVLSAHVEGLRERVAGYRARRPGLVADLARAEAELAAFVPGDDTPIERPLTYASDRSEG